MTPNEARRSPPSARVRTLLLALYLLAALGDAAAKGIAASPRLLGSLARHLPAGMKLDSARPPQGNFEIFREASRRLEHGEDVYAPYANKSRDRFKYSPTFALLFAPLASLPWPIALFLWSGLNALVLFVALEQLLPATEAYLALAFLLPEVLRSMQNAQSNALVAALIVLSFTALERGRVWRAAAATVLGGFIKIFPLAALSFAIPRRKTLTVGVAALIVSAVLAVAPLVVAWPAQLLGQYRSWTLIESADATQRWFSMMELFHRWFGGDAPNWPFQLVGTAMLLTPVALRRDRWGDARFRFVFLCSVLVYVTIFNHQAERSSYLIAFVGATIWFVSGERTTARRILYGIALLTIPLMSTLIPVPTVFRSPTAMTYRLALPMTVIWLVMQGDLLRSAPAPVAAATRGALQVPEVDEPNPSRV